MTDTVAEYAHLPPHPMEPFLRIVGRDLRLGFRQRADASLVVLFFMHVRYNTPLMWVFAAAGFFAIRIRSGAITVRDQ